MRNSILAAVASAVAAVACSSQDSQAKGDSATTTPAVAPVEVTPAPKTLKSAMKAIEEDWKVVEAAIARLQKGESADLASTEASARRVAQAMRFAYDPFEDKEVPDFATMAKEAEAALHSFAEGCRQGNHASLTEIGKTLQEQHCARCHDATEEAKG